MEKNQKINYRGRAINAFLIDALALLFRMLQSCLKRRMGYNKGKVLEVFFEEMLRITQEAFKFENNMCWSPFSKVLDYWPAALLKKKMTNVFDLDVYEFFKTAIRYNTCVFCFW